MSSIKFPENKNPIIVTSHPRSGTHLCIDLLRRQYDECNISKTLNRGLDDLYFSIEGLLSNTKNIRNVERKGLRVLNSCSCPIIKYHGYSKRTLLNKYPDWMNYLSSAKTIYVYRNIYEVLCSTYIYMQTFDNAGKGVSLSEFIRQPFAGSPSRVDFWVNEINDFSNDNNVLLLSYEEIIKDTSNVLDKLDEFLEIKAKKKNPLLPPKTNNKWKIRWQRFFSRNPDNTAILASFEGIKKLEPAKAFSEDDLLYINEKAENTLLHLGLINLSKSKI